jgi:hypothetical protein
MSPVSVTTFADALLADAPTSDRPARMRSFGRLVGSWAVKGRRLDEASGAWREREFTWMMSFILEGRAVQDIEVVETDDGPKTAATAVRVYDPVAGVWRVSYFAPKTDDYCHLSAVSFRDGIRQDGTQTDGRPIRWNFSAITADSYTWDAWVSNDDGSTWVLTEHTEGTRIS